jgi:hypothetical protein
MDQAARWVQSEVEVMDMTLLGLLAFDAAAATLICGYLLGHLDEIDGALTSSFDPLAVANIWGGPGSGLMPGVAPRHGAPLKAETVHNQGPIDTIGLFRRSVVLPTASGETSSPD